MPGIFGVIDLNGSSSQRASERLDLVRRMARAMRTEPAYVVDLVSCPALGTCAGRVGWAYEALRAARTETNTLLTAGEPVFHIEPTATYDDECALIGTGARDVAQALQQRGVERLGDVEGSFAGFLIDQRAGQCVLFNDRYGIERLFLHTEEDRVFFSSEAKAILAVAPPSREFDSAGLAEWLACGCTLGARSLFQGVEVLTAGTAVVFKGRRAGVRIRYFDRSRLEQLPQVSAGQFVDEFTSSLDVAVQSAVRRSPRAGISLTGGLDSRLIIASINAAPGTVPCYTFGSMYRSTMDVSVAKAVAAQCDQPHQALVLDRRFLTGIADHFRRAVCASDGYMGLAGAAELYLNTLANRVAPARVTGNWGGELMRGVRAFKFRMPKGNFIRSPIREMLPEVAQAFGQPASWNPLSFTLFFQVPQQGFSRYAVERSQVLMRSPFLAHNVVKALYQAPAATRSGIELVENILRRRPGLIEVPTDLGRLGHSSRPVARLRQTWRRLLIKAEYMTSHGAPDWMATLAVLVPPLETAFLGRDKFQHFRLWMRHELSGMVRDVVLRDPGAGMDSWFDMHQVAQMVDAHLAGRANYTDELDKVMTVAMVRRTVASEPTAAPPRGYEVRELPLAMPMARQA